MHLSSSPHPSFSLEWQQTIDSARELAHDIQIPRHCLFPTADTPGFSDFLEFVRTHEPFSSAFSSSPQVSDSVDVGFMNHREILKLAKALECVTIRTEEGIHLSGEQVTRVVNTAYDNKSLADGYWKVKSHTIDQVIATLLAGCLNPDIFDKQNVDNPTDYFQKMTSGERSGYRFQAWSGLGKYGNALNHAVISDVSGGNHRLLAARMYNRLVREKDMMHLFPAIYDIPCKSVQTVFFNGKFLDNFLDTHILIDKKRIHQKESENSTKVPVFSSLEHNVQLIDLGNIGSCIEKEVGGYVCINKKKLEYLLQGLPEGKIRQWYDSLA
jgi:hypothetical protein